MIFNTIRRNLFLKLISQLKKGQLNVTLENGQVRIFKGSEPGRDAELNIKDARAYGKILSASDIGLAEAYRDGWLDSPNMAELLLLCLENQEALEKGFKGTALGMLLYKTKHYLNRNSKAGSKKNIQAHYDLGNNFYQLWLDSTMTYSAAIFKHEDETLESAQKNKYQRIIDTLQLKSTDHILEIGCGWGGFATMAALQSGCRVTCLTLSQEQFNHAQSLVDKLNLEDLITIKLCDYRDERGVYDHIVSIEMIEAVGQEYWNTYFEVLKERLKPGGKVMIQSIVMDDEHFDHYRQSTDFIQQYIFPGGMLLAPKVLKDFGQKYQLQVKDFFNFGLDYAKTLQIWRQEFMSNIDSVRRIGFDESFLKLWDFYYVYCEAGFRSKKIDVVQIVYEKAR